MLNQPLPAHVKVRVKNPKSADYGRIGVIVSAMDIQMGKKHGDWLVRFPDHDTVFADDDLETVKDA